MCIRTKEAGPDVNAILPAGAHLTPEERLAGTKA